MSYLDDPRVLFAAESSLLAWQRTAIALVGFVVERFGRFLRMVGGCPLRHQPLAADAQPPSNPAHPAQ
jgi:putative membrane protein